MTIEKKKLYHLSQNYHFLTSVLAECMCYACLLVCLAPLLLAPELILPLDLYWNSVLEHSRDSRVCIVPNRPQHGTNYVWGISVKLSSYDTWVCQWTWWTWTVTPWLLCAVLVFPFVSMVTNTSLLPSGFPRKDRTTWTWRSCGTTGTFCLTQYDPVESSKTHKWY